MFFVLNVGRSGSRTIAQVLSQAPNCRCEHEPEPQLVEEAHAYRTGDLAQEDLVELLRSSRPVDGPAEGADADDDAASTEVRGESANRLSFVIPALREAFPNAQHVWLVRDGRAMVSSALQRGWYDPDRDAMSYGRHRPTAVQLGDVDEATWASWEPFERLCWYWARLNRQIREDADDPRLVRVEQLDQEVDALATWLGLEPTSFVVTRANRRYTDDEPRPPHARRSNHVDQLFTVDDWTSDQHETFRQHCGDLMDDLYPGWAERPPDSWASSTAAGSEEVIDQHLLAGVHEQLAELRFFQQEMMALRQERQDLRTQVQGLEDRLDACIQERDDHHDARQRLTDARQRLTAELAELRDRADDLQRQLATAREERRTQVTTLKTEAAAQLRRERARRTEILQSRTYRTALGLKRISSRVRSTSRRAALAFDRALPDATAPDSTRASRDTSRPAAPAADHALAPVSPWAEHVAARLVTVPDIDGSVDGAVLYALMVWDPTPDDLASVVQEVRTLQRGLGGFAVVYITDSEAFHVFRTDGIVFEHIPPARHRQGPGDEDWASFRDRRLALLMEAYRPNHVMLMSPGAEGRAGSLAALEASVRALPVDRQGG